MGGLVAISNAGARAEDEKVDTWAKIFMDEGALFLNVISKLYKIIHGCTTEEWNRIQPKFLWEKNEEDQNRRLLSSGYYRTDDCDSDNSVSEKKVIRMFSLLFVWCFFVKIFSQNS